MDDQAPAVIAGVDTHKDTHYAAVITDTGRHLESAPFPASVDGYRALTAFITGFGPVSRVGVEGTGSYGAGLARHLTGSGLDVVEVLRPTRQVRRMRGKSDEIDAYAAAESALAGTSCSTPKHGDGLVEPFEWSRPPGVQQYTLPPTRPCRSGTSSSPHPTLSDRNTVCCMAKR